MDNIAQSMRFSPNPIIVFRNPKPKLAFGENQGKLTTQHGIRGAFRATQEARRPH